MRSFVVAVVALMGLATAIIAPWSSVTRAAPMTPRSSMDKADTLRAGMRKLWEDHVTWTRLFIVSAVAGLPDAQPTLNRLLRNQDDLGNAIKPFFGDAAGTRLAALLRDHITIA